MIQLPCGHCQWNNYRSTWENLRILQRGSSVTEWLERRIWIPFWPLADVGSLEFNFSSTLVNSQLVCLPPVGILSHVMFIYHYLFTLVLKSPDGEWPITYTFTFTRFFYRCWNRYTVSSRHSLFLFESESKMKPLSPEKPHISLRLVM